MYTCEDEKERDTWVNGNVKYKHVALYIALYSIIDMYV